NGKMVEIPDGLQFLVPTKILPMAASPLLSWPSKLRMALEWFRRSPAKSDHDRSVAEFVEEHYGREAVDYLAEPLLAGIYGGDPAKLSVRSVLPRFVELESKYGSLTRGVLAERSAAPDGPRAPLFSTLRDGLGRLVSAASQASARTNFIHKSVVTIERTSAGFR